MTVTDNDNFTRPAPRLTFPAGYVPANPDAEDALLAGDEALEAYFEAMEAAENDLCDVEALVVGWASAIEEDVLQDAWDAGLLTWDGDQFLLAY